MKKIAIALTAMAAFTGSAYAADMAPRAYTKAPVVVAAVPSWTGCYVGGGGGYGLWNQENTYYSDRAVLAGTGPRVQLSDTSTAGGRGYLGTVQAGCDYQFGLGGYNLVVGAFGDYDFSSMKGNLTPPFTPLVGSEKLSSAWSVGGRLGVLITPSLLTYFSGGYTEAKFDGVNFTNLSTANGTLPLGLSADRSFNGQTYKGWFLGAGDEYALSFLPGLFWKTEYRFSRFDTGTNPFIITSTGLRGTDSDDSKKWVQTVRSELTYHFNWGGPVVAKY